MNINRGDIWYIGNGYPAVGSEQRPGRPAVVVSNQQNNRYGEVVEVIYLTTAPKRDLPTHVTIRSSGRVSTALCEQISTVSVERLGDYCCHVSDSELTAIENAMLISLGIQLAPVSEESEETPPMPESRLAEVEARCRVLQELYDALLDRFVKAG